MSGSARGARNAGNGPAAESEKPPTDLLRMPQ
jgi:hypothetical protein